MPSSYDHREQTERFAILALLSRTGELSTSGLCFNARSCTSRLRKLSELCAEGLVERTADHLYALTDAGRAEYERMQAPERTQLGH